MTYDELREYGVNITREQFVDLIFLNLRTGGIYTTVDLIAMLHLLGLLEPKKADDDGSDNADQDCTNKTKDFFRDYPTADRETTLDEFFPFRKDPTVTRHIKEFNEAHSVQILNEKRKRRFIYAGLFLNFLVSVAAILIAVFH